MIWNFKIFSRIYYSLLIVVIVLTIGSIGFMWIENYSLVEAIYMTVITVSTVGFGEVRPLTPEGMLFTSFLIITSIGTFAYTISAITTYFVAGEYKNLFKTRQVEKQLEKISDHVIVCGHGRVGDMTRTELLDHYEELIVIENDDSKVKLLREKYNILTIQGDATKDENLLAAGIMKAKAIITTLPDDAMNLYVVLTAREMNKDLTIISRASKSESVRKLRIAGATNVIMPDRVGGAHMASLVSNPNVMEFLDHIRIQGSTGINLEEIQFRDLPKGFQYRTIGDLQRHNRVGVNIIGFKVDEEYEINPGPETVIVPNCRMFVLGNEEQIATLNKVLGL